MNYNLGLVSISFRGLSPKEILHEMKKSGLTHIEWGSDVHAPNDNLENLEYLVSLGKEYGITCCSYGTYFNLGVDNTDELEKYIKAAKILGTDILRLWCGDKGSAEYSEWEREALILECKKAAKIAEKHNVKFCLECHNWTYTDTKDSALWLIKEVSSPNFLMYWQPNQFKTFDENIQYIKALKPYITILHVFNWEGKNRLPLQDGINTWQEYLKVFGEDKTLLLEFVPDDKIETLSKEVKALKEIVGE